MLRMLMLMGLEFIKVLILNLDFGIQVRDTHAYIETAATC